MTDLSALIERVESGATKDAALETEICLAVVYGGINSHGALNLRTEEDWTGDLLFEIEEEDDQGTMVLVDCCNPVPALTTSLDAVLSLIEAKLPKHRAAPILIFALGKMAENGDPTGRPIAEQIARFTLAAALRAIQESRGAMLSAAGDGR